MQMERLKGTIDRIENGVVVIVSKKDDYELYFDEADFDSPIENKKVDLLIARSDDPMGLSKVISAKKVTKPKKIKMKNFSSLIRAMLKVKSRLEATLEEEGENSDSLNDLREKVEFLEKGIELFS